MPTYDAAAFQRDRGVSRETLDKLIVYNDLLLKWSRAINLVGRDTLGNAWRRHFLDSAQLWPYLQAGPPGPLADFGSGAGFPGLVLAILGWPEVHLIESDGKKAAFLAAVSRETATPIRLHNARIEEISPLSVQWATARALAPLPRLLDYAVPHLRPGGACLFLKGRSLPGELQQAAQHWRFRQRTWPSCSGDGGEEDGWIVQLDAVARPDAG